MDGLASFSFSTNEIVEQAFCGACAFEATADLEEIESAIDLVSVVAGEEMLEVSGSIVEEVLRDSVVVGLLVGDCARAARGIELKEGCIRVRHENRRMRGHNKL